MSCITQILKMKGNKEFLPIFNELRNVLVIEGGGNYEGYEYLIIFTDLGIRCGYVAIPSNNTYDVDSINCHGGITFKGDDHEAKMLSTIPCADIWIGFDAGHYSDKRDFNKAKHYFPNRLDRTNSLEELNKNLDDIEEFHVDCSHKTYEYMENECKSIISQLIKQQKG